MDQSFIEYMDRYDDHIFIIIGEFIFVGKLLEKSIVKKHKCNCYKLIDMVNKNNVHYKTNAYLVSDGYGKVTEYKRGEIYEDKMIEFYDNYIDPFYNNQYYEIGDKVRYLFMGEGCNDPNFKCPDTVTHLVCGKTYNQPIDHIPDSVTHIVFGRDFNQPIDDLPDSVEQIIMDKRYDKVIKRLSRSLKLFIFREGCKLLKYVQKFEEAENYNDAIVLHPDDDYEIRAFLNRISMDNITDFSKLIPKYQQKIEYRNVLMSH